MRSVDKTSSRLENFKLSRGRFSFSRCDLLISGKARVEEWIKLHELKWRVLDMPSSTKTVDDAARALGVSKSVIVKTLVVICENAVLAVIVPGDRRLDMSKLENLAKNCRFAKPKEVEILTGYPAGGVPPVALPESIKVIMDRVLLDKDVVYGGGGDLNSLLEFSPRDLVSLGFVVILDVSR